MKGAAGSDIPIQSVDKKGRLGDLHLAFVTDEEVVKEHAQWWRSDMKGKIDTHTRMDPDASVVLGSGGPVLSSQKKRMRKSEAHADLAQKAKVRELEA